MQNIKNLPKISVIIPSYNKVAFIEKTLQSLVDQKYPSFEIIIRDGGSTDGSVEIIKKFASNYLNLIRWVSQKDKGQVDAINSGIRKATGEIVTYINADDILKKDALLRVGEVFSKNPNILWVTGLGDIIDERGSRIFKWVTIYKNFLVKINLLIILLIVNYITQPSTFWRRNIHKKIGFLKGTRKFVLEYEFWLRLSKIQKPAVLESSLSSFRLSSNNISASSSVELLAEDLKIAQKYTDNKLILFFHRLHNLARIGLITLFKK